MFNLPIETLALWWIGIALFLVPIQLKIIAPYGRHINTNWGLMIDNKWGWIIMEIVSPITLLFFFYLSYKEITITLLFIMLLWILHYTNRSLLFPFRMKTKGKKIPLMIVFSAIFFNIINAGMNGYYLGKFGTNYPPEYVFNNNFIIGFIIFCLGAIINIHSDNILLNLRKPNEQGYKIPTGGLFKYLSCPNHFGEIIEWIGFAILCWNLPALSFAIWTAANLMPRALAHHHWYQQYFSDYPKERKAVIPFMI